MKRTALSLLMCTVLSSPLMAATIDCRSDSDTSVKGQKTLLKTFTYEYWQVAVNNINLLPVDLHQKGLVVGDFHFNNLGLYFDARKAQAETVVNDFDDAGHNYLVVDLSKYLAFIKAEVKKVDLAQVFEAYIKGLNGQKAKEPQEIKDLLKEKASFYNQQYQKYVGKKMQEAEEFDSKSLSSAQLSTLEFFTRHESLTDLRQPNVIFRINDTGSSLGMERYEFVGRNSQNQAKVIEFKQLKCSASGAPRRQDLNDSFNAVQGFYSRHFPSDYMLSQKIIFYNSNFYLVREKINNPLKKIDVDKMSAADQQDYADYYANFLGLIQSKSSTKRFANAVSANQNEILKFVKKISDEFNSEVK